jgi:predicted ArsR family transcriptional regulator
MHDPMMRQSRTVDPTWEDAPLFGTRHAAGQAAARTSGKRRTWIKQLLADRGPMTCFELAAEMNLHDHQISGRITDLLKDGEIERTGQTKRKPETGCLCDIYRLVIP